MKWLCIVCLFGCSDFINAWDGYVIPKGDHYSHRSGMPPRVVSLFDGRHLHFSAQFTESCIYVPSDSSINKLYGFTDCNSAVHQNSVRFGWRVRSDSTFDLFAYWYLDERLNWKYLGNTKIYTEDDYEIWAKGDEYSFRFNETRFTTLRTKQCVHGIRERLFPYFGGDDVAPHEMLILVYEYD